MKNLLSKIKELLLKFKDFIILNFDPRKDPKNKYRIMAAAGTVLIICSVVAGIIVVVNYIKAREKYDSIEDDYGLESIAEPIKVPEPEPIPEPEPEPEPEDTATTPEKLNAEWGELTGVDFLSFKEDYPEAVGWIYFEDDDISYPIMFSGDNEKYLHTAYDGTALFAGAIFLDEESTMDFSDPHSLVYGHNMADESMFGKLRKYLYEQDYYENHQYFQIFNGEQILRYRIFAYGLIPANSLIYWTFGPNPDDMQALVDTIISESRIKPEDLGIEVTTDDTIMTLSTCSGDENTRTVVCAVLLPEEEIPSEADSPKSDDSSKSD